MKLLLIIGPFFICACNIESKNSPSSLKADSIKLANEIELINQRSNHSQWMIKMYFELKKLGYSESRIWRDIDSMTKDVYDSIPSYHETEKQKADSLIKLETK